MNKLSLVLLLLSLLSCKKENNDNHIIVGTWKLSEILSDPGDGNGTYIPVESDKTITFNTNGELYSNGDLCSLLPDTKKSTKGTYSLDSFTFTSQDCNHSNLEYNFVIEDNHLTIIYPCIETCRAKFLKI